MFRFDDEARPLALHLTEALRLANGHDSFQRHAAQRGTYGQIYEAICLLLAVECGDKEVACFRQHGANFGGNENWLDDLEVMVTEVRRT